MSAPAETVKRRTDGRASVYVHIPFCDRICPYCDFAVTSIRDVPHEAYAEALIREWRARSEALDGRAVRSIYFGGGTPSRWSPGALARVLALLREDLGAQVEEITMEVNPVDVTPQRLDVWCAAGVNRISLGCQSFQPEVLKFLGRNHSAAQAMRAVAQWLERDVEVSVDMIYGSPMQTMALWEKDLDVLVALCERGVRHVSSYHLTIEAGTPFARRVAKGEIKEQDEAQAVAMVEALRGALAKVGVRPYEVSSWSVPGHESVHNSSYWMGAEYLGLGMGAHGLRIDERGAFRRQNAATLAQYLHDPVGDFVGEEVSPQDHLDERVFVGARSIFGVNLEELRQQFGLDRKHVERLSMHMVRLCEEGLFVCEDGRMIPTWEGMQVADMVGEMLVGGGTHAI